MLAADPITIEIAGEVIELRPTLRAATRLARRYGDFATLYRNLASDHVTSLHDVLREGSGDPAAAGRFLSMLDAPRAHGVAATFARAKDALLEFVSGLASIDEPEGKHTVRASKPVTFAERHAELFRIGTGWLGWTPAETWNATPAEIIAAYEGRLSMLKAIYGSADDGPDDPPSSEFVPPVLDDAGRDPAFDRNAFASLKAKFGKHTHA